MHDIVVIYEHDIIHASLLTSESIVAQLPQTPAPNQLAPRTVFRDQRTGVEGRSELHQLFAAVPPRDGAVDGAHDPMDGAHALLQEGRV